MDAMIGGWVYDGEGVWLLSAGLVELVEWTEVASMYPESLLIEPAITLDEAEPLVTMTTADEAAEYVLSLRRADTSVA